MTKDEAQDYFDNKKICWARVSGGKAQVLIVRKIETPGYTVPGYAARRNATTEWIVRRVDNERELSARHAGALHKTKDFLKD